MFLNFQMWRAEIHVNLQGICQRKAESFNCAHLGVKSPCYGHVAVRWMDVSPITMSIYGGDPLLRHAEAAPHIDSVRSPWYGDNTDVEFHVLGGSGLRFQIGLDARWNWASFPNTEVVRCVCRIRLLGLCIARVPW